MLYDALQVSRYIITRCLNTEKRVSNLKLQKMLYFVWADFYKKTGRYLFTDQFCAWQHGPVIPSVYYEYCPYAGRPILIQYTSEIDESDEPILDSIIDNYSSMNAAELVNKTHTPGLAWDNIYRNGLGNREVIPFSLIIDKEIRN